jgi:condensin complex subunit 1
LKNLKKIKVFFKTFKKIKGNIIIAIGDLSSRFPNIVEPWIKYLYDCLSDNETIVKKKTLMVLRHLILNDMIKAKTYITDIARKILDEDENICNLAKSFFNDLSKKSGSDPIYNLIPDAIGKLSLTENEEDFKIIIKFLLSFITKDKQIDKLGKINKN